MVDPLGIKPVLTSDRTVARVMRVAAPTTADTVTAQDHVAGTAAQLTHDLSTPAPIDHDRVARIRKAITEGAFPIYPAQIADRLIAFKLEWHPNEHR